MTLPSFTLTLTLTTSLAAAPGSEPSGRLDFPSDQDADRAALRGELDGMRWLVFGEDEVDGAVDRPLEQVVPHRRAAKGGSLLHVRTHFVPELLRYAFDL
jgi:hypothetical protein